jgi:KipI family sensor histidine kinase inhibitor
MRFLPAGPSAVLVELDDEDAVFSLLTAIERHRAAGWECRVTDVVPGARTVLLDGLDDPGTAAAAISGWTLPPPAGRDGPLVEIPCRYDGQDLLSVARCWGVRAEDIGALHSSREHRVAFCGFSPGFAYLVGVGDLPEVPRLATPRPVVEAGSVALAGGYTGIYPRPSPGGWQIIGHTDVVCWDPERTPPALLAPGTWVRFVIR